MTMHPDTLTYENTAGIGRFVNIFVDGVELRNCAAANPTEGWADFYPEENGRFVILGSEIEIRRVHGVVTVVDIPPLTDNVISEDAPK